MVIFSSGVLSRRATGLYFLVLHHHPGDGLARVVPASGRSIERYGKMAKFFTRLQN